MVQKLLLKQANLPGKPTVRSYMAVPVLSRNSEIIGGLVFGHPEVGIFTARDERIVRGIAAQAAIAIDNARLVEDLRRTEYDLGRQLEYTRNITESVGEGLYAVDQDGRATFVNPAAERMLGWGAAATIVLGLLFGPALAGGALMVVFAMLAGALLVMGFVYGPLGGWMPTLFPVTVRYTGISIAFNVGGILGGGDGAAKGAAIGGAGGTGVVLATKGKEVRLGPGAAITTRLTAPLTVRVKS